MAPTDDFETVRRRAIEAIEREDVVSVYAGLIHEDRQDAYYFANDVDDDELQRMAVRQLGMLTRVLTEQSDLTAEEVTELARERADEMNLQP